MPIAPIRAVLACLVSILLVACAGSSSPATPPRPLTFAVIGASDSVGIGASNPSKTGWVPVLLGMLPAGTRMVNAGIDGARVATALEQELPVVLGVDPDVVAIWITVNDINARTPLAEYERDLDTLLTSLKARTRAKVFLANVPNLTALPLYRNIPRAQLNAEMIAWNEVIARQAEKHGAILVDLNKSAYSQELADRPEYVSADGFHPSDTGYKRLAEVFYEALDAAGVIPAPR